MGGLWSVISAVVVACITSAPAQAQSERAAHQAQWEGVNFGRRSPSSEGQGEKLPAYNAPSDDWGLVCA
jgi:hypothetical protein